MSWNLEMLPNVLQNIFAKIIFTGGKNDCHVTATRLPILKKSDRRKLSRNRFSRCFGEAFCIYSDEIMRNNQAEFRGHQNIDKCLIKFADDSINTAVLQSCNMMIFQRRTKNLPKHFFGIYQHKMNMENYGELAQILEITLLKFSIKDFVTS